MRDAGVLTICKLANISKNGDMPAYELIEEATAFYSEMTIGVTRAYAAMSVNKRIDMVARCWNTEVPYGADYVILENGEQFRIDLKQKAGDHVDLTLIRLEDKYNVDKSNQEDKRSFVGT